MSKVRINDLARELEVKSRAILDALTHVGVTEKKTHSSSLEEDEAERVRQHFQRSGKNGAGAARVDTSEPKQKIDWSRVSKPGDVLKAIQQRKDEAAAAAQRPTVPTPVQPQAARAAYSGSSSRPHHPGGQRWTESRRGRVAVRARPAAATPPAIAAPSCIREPSPRFPKLPLARLRRVRVRQDRFVQTWVCNQVNVLLLLRHRRHGESFPSPGRSRGSSSPRRQPHRQLPPSPPLGQSSPGRRLQGRQARK